METTKRDLISEHIQWRARTEVVTVELMLTDAQANALYNDIYRIQRDIPGSRSTYPLLFAVYDTLDKAGVDGTR